MLADAGGRWRTLDVYGFVWLCGFNTSEDLGLFHELSTSDTSVASSFGCFVFIVQTICLRFSLKSSIYYRAVQKRNQPRPSKLCDLLATAGIAAQAVAKAGITRLGFDDEISLLLGVDLSMST